MCLKSICDDVLSRKDLYANINPKTGQVTTYCNIAVDLICKNLGINDFHNESGAYLANKIIDILDKKWILVGDKDACVAAAQGILCIAGKKDVGHGHVSVIYPDGKMTYSASWHKMVPNMANIGYTSGILPCSRCFKTEPSYYIRA